MKFGSLFAGFDGLGWGLELAGMVCEWQVEIEEYARQILKQRQPNVFQWDDIHTFPPKGWNRRVDLICGGDPCQENSNARQRTGLESPSLGAEFIRVLDALRPTYFLRENPSAVRSDAPWPWWRFRSSAESIGYVVLPFRVRACCLGADHQRDRLFLLGELPNSMQAGLERDVIAKVARTGGGEGIRDITRQDRRSTASRICRASDGVPYWKHRIKGLGNAVDRRVGEFIGRAIMSSFYSTEGSNHGFGNCKEVWPES